jgi:hypothetical protein
MTTKARKLADLGNVYDDGALSNRNLIINGAMQVAQRGTSSTSDNYQTVDRFRTNFEASLGVTQTQESLTTGDPYDEGFRNFYRQENTSVSSATNSNLQIFQYIESQDIASSGWNYTSPSSYITLSFWVRSSLAGTYNACFRTFDGTGQWYASEFTIAANTWTKITKSVPGNSSLQFDNNNDRGLQIDIIAHWGTDYTDSGFVFDQWAAFSSSSRAQDFDQDWGNTASATFDITAVQLEVGDTATPFEHRSYGDELARCQRYYEVLAEGQSPSDGVGNLLGNITQYNSTLAIGIVPFKVTKRALPTGVVAGGNAFRVYSGGGNQTSSAVTVDGDTSLTKARIDITVNGTAGYATWARGQGSSCLIAVDAEL